jgi:hypothetical protein
MAGQTIGERATALLGRSRWVAIPLFWGLTRSGKPDGEGMSFDDVLTRSDK